MKKVLEFHHGALCDSYEEQANKQGYTLGDKAKFADKVAFGIVAAHIHGCITDGEYNKILQRFQKKVIMENLKPLKGGDQE